jgi:hypothetical protein
MPIELKPAIIPAAAGFPEGAGAGASFLSFSDLASEDSSRIVFALASTARAASLA